MTTKTNWKHLDGDTDQCSHPRCRATMEVIYSAGATALNRKKRLQLCDQHLAVFCAEQTSASSEDRPQQGESYLLVGKADQASIARGNTWEESRVPEDATPPVEPRSAQDQGDTSPYPRSFTAWWAAFCAEVGHVPSYRTPAEMKEGAQGYCFRRIKQERDEGLTVQAAFEARGRVFGWFQ